MNDQPVKILLVDDTPQNLVALEALLRRTDVELLKARSGAEALEMCLQHEFSLALLDVQMPEMDGYELAELMRGAERTKHVPIVFVTAAARDQQRTFKGYESGAVDFLYKPLDPQILSSKVNVFIELARQRRELTRALQLNELFVGILGHDLRNPLAAISAGVDLLGMTLTDPNALRVLERMRNSGHRMESMINDMLDLTRARFTPGLGLARSKEPVDLHDVLAQTIEELRASHHRDVRLEGLPSCATSGDRERMLQLFSNLIGNAIVHGAPEKPITTRIAACAPEAVVEVHNFGVIPSELSTSLFEPFRRSRQGKVTKGLGLGLYIARQIAQAHGGDIQVSSSEPSGTIFTVRLPATSAAA